MPTGPLSLACADGVPGPPCCAAAAAPPRTMWVPGERPKQNPDPRTSAEKGPLSLAGPRPSPEVAEILVRFCLANTGHAKQLPACVPSAHPHTPPDAGGLCGFGHVPPPLWASVSPWTDRREGRVSQGVAGPPSCWWPSSPQALQDPCWEVADNARPPSYANLEPPPQPPHPKRVCSGNSG